MYCSGAVRQGHVACAGVCTWRSLEAESAPYLLVLVSCLSCGLVILLQAHPAVLLTSLSCLPATPPSPVHPIWFPPTSAMQGYGNQRFVFQGVHETICYGPSDKPWGETEPRINQIVFIGRKLDRKALMEGFR